MKYQTQRDSPNVMVQQRQMMKDSANHCYIAAVMMQVIPSDDAEH